MNANKATVETVAVDFACAVNTATVALTVRFLAEVDGIVAANDRRAGERWMCCHHIAGSLTVRRIRLLNVL